MPRPIPILGSSPQIDPTLPSIVKPPLYQHDEHQTYSLIQFKEIPIKTGGDPTKTTEEEKTPGKVIRSFNDINGNQFYEGGEQVTREIQTLDGFSGVSGSGGILLQYYSPDGYKWCEEYFNKLYVLFNNSVYRYRVLPQPDSIKLTHYEPVYGDEIIWSSDTSIEAQPAFDINHMEFVWSGTNYFHTDEYGVEREYPLNWLRYRWLKETIIKYEVVKGKQLWQGSLDPAFEQLLGGSTKVEIIEFEHKSTENSAICFTYWYKDGLCRKDSTQCCSRGHRIIRFGIGLNKISVPLNLDIFACSVVVSTIEGSNSSANALKDAINQLSPRLLFDNFDVEIPKLIALDYVRLGYTESISVANQIVVYHANNNYWKNGLQPNDIAITENQYPFVDLTVIDDIYYKIDKEGFYGNDMPDSVRVQEIHAALEAQKFANDSKTNNQRVANLGYYIERIARVLGISVYEDGKTKAIRQVRRIKPGDTIGAGYDFGQFGLNAVGTPDTQVGGNPGELRDGIIYEQRCNKLTPDKYDPKKSTIEPGDYILCENIPQLLMQVLDDMDKALGWQELGAGAVPSHNPNNQPMLYEGLSGLVAELAFMLSAISNTSGQALIASKVSQGIAQEILAALGLPVGDKVFYESLGDGKEPMAVNYPGLLDQGITVTQQMGWILQNVALLVANSVAYDESKFRS